MKRLLYLTAVTLVCAFTFNIVLCSNVKAASFSGTAVVEESIKHNITDDFEIDEYGVLKKYTGSDSHVIIPEGVVSIGYMAFFGCGDFLTQVIIPDSVTSIGDNAFWGCVNLINITIPNSVTEIGEGAFLYCLGLRSITIPDSITEIEDNLFSHCTSLTDIKLPSSMTYIGLQAVSYTHLDVYKRQVGNIVAIYISIISILNFLPVWHVHSGQLLLALDIETSYIIAIRHQA